MLLLFVPAFIGAFVFLRDAKNAVSDDWVKGLRQPATTPIRSVTIATSAVVMTTFFAVHFKKTGSGRSA